MALVQNLHHLGRVDHRALLPCRPDQPVVVEHPANSKGGGVSKLALAENELVDVTGRIEDPLSPRLAKPFTPPPSQPDDRAPKIPGRSPTNHEPGPPPRRCRLDPNEE